MSELFFFTELSKQVKWTLPSELRMFAFEIINFQCAQGTNATCKFPPIEKRRSAMLLIFDRQIRSLFIANTKAF